MQPILLSLLTCNRVIFDRMSGTPSIIDIVQVVNAPKFPVRLANLVFFCELTNGHGKSDLNVKLIKSDNEKILFDQTRPVEFKDVQQVISVTLNMQGIIFPEPGQYHFQLFSDDQFLGERRINCRKVELKEPPK